MKPIRRYAPGVVSMMAERENQPFRDDVLAADLVGKTILLGLTYVQREGDRHEQMFGRVTSADRSGIAIQLEGQRTGETFKLPPDLRSVERAPPGDFCLKNTGEHVIDPDYLCTWTIYPRPQ